MRRYIQRASKMKIVILITVLLLSTGAYAKQKDNPVNNTWEAASSDPAHEYNQHENSWSNEQKGSTIEYNYSENKWEFAPPEIEEEQGREPSVYGWERE